MNSLIFRLFKGARVDKGLRSDEPGREGMRLDLADPLSSKAARC